MTIKRSVSATIAVAAMVAMTSGARVRVVAQATDHDHATPAAKNADQAQPAGQNMMAMHQKMMADNKAADARLAPLVEKMNAAKGEAKVEAMAAVINELVSQRTMMRGQMDQMSQMMMMPGMGPGMMNSTMPKGPARD